MNERSLRLAIAAGLAIVVLAGAWGTAVAADRRVTMDGNAYHPATVTINAGDTVTWRNDDTAPHDAVGNGWSTSLLTTGRSDAVTFRRAGRYRYTCSIHPEMRGTVVVRGGAGATVPPTDASAATMRPEASASVTVPLLLLAGSALLMALLWRRRDQAET